MPVGRWLLVLLAVVACNDVREFEGAWHGSRVGDNPVLRTGLDTTASCDLEIDGIDTHGMRGVLTIDGLVDRAPIASAEGAEADALASLTFAGSPLRVYIAFADTADGADPLTVFVALYDSRRVEVRAMRGGAKPVYGIFALAPQP
jgi:hypothetical protein